MPEIKEEILILPKNTLIPNHIAVILDGNRRWARAHGFDTFKGHRAGFEAARRVARSARKMGIHTFTVWGFSTENWDRSPREIAYLMKLYKEFVLEVRKEADKDGIRMVHLGRKDRFPKNLMKLINEVEKETRHNTKHVLNVALDYGGRDEIIRAVKKIIKNNISANKIDEKTFATYLDTGDQPYPYVDLFIRPSGEQRTSGLLPWQMTYAEIYWEEDNLPDMTPDKLREAIIDFSRRRRRFGGNDKEDHLKFRPEIAAKFEVNWWRLQNIPEGTKFTKYAYEHVKEVFGLSGKLATEAALLMTQALIEGEEKKWHKAGIKLGKFYKLIKAEVKLAFEPSIVASLEIKSWQNKKDEEAATDLLAETYRISEFQAKKAAHLKVLASNERDLAQGGEGDHHWELAREYLVKYYTALKDRVA